MGRLRYIYLAAVICISLAVGMPGAHLSAEAEGLRVNGAMLVTEVNPGENLKHKIAVQLSPTDAATDISVKVEPVGQSPDGTYLASDSSIIDVRYSASSFITLDKNIFHLEPGSTGELTATIQIPTDIGPGGRYALITLQTQPSLQGAISVVRAIHIPIYLTIKDSVLIHTGKIRDTTTGEVGNGRPIDILTRFQNTGNHHFKIKGDVIVYDPRGDILDVLYTSLSTSSILPDSVRQLKTTFIPRNDLLTGTYSYCSKARLEDGTLLDEIQSSFEVKDFYTPPSAPIYMIANPSSRTELKTADGVISITLPEDAVIAETRLALIPLPSDQMPSPPAGSELSGLCFRLDGLNGLLAKPALVTLKYSEVDLEKAGGDVSRLKIARWDEASDRWIKLVTSQDEQAMEISAETNQFGIVAVLIEPPAAVDASLIFKVGAVFLLLIFMGVFIIMKSNKRKNIVRKIRLKKH
jgi:hypothetical protein